MPVFKLLLSFLFSILGLFVFSQLPNVETVAGDGMAGYIDSTGLNAQLNTPHSIDFDSNGNIYFCDNGNHVIRMITSAGVVSTIAGDGISGYVNGPVASAQFGSLLGICRLPNNGDIYVTEYNHRIRKISGGIVSDYAGNGSAGSLNGIGTSATFNVPSVVGAGVNNNLFILDRFNHKIRTINIMNDSVADYAGSGTPGLLDGSSNSAQFDRPHDFCIDSTGNIFVADRDNHVIRKVDILGNVTTIAGSGFPGYVNGTGNSASFNVPSGIATDKLGNLYIGDRGNHVIRKIDQSNNVTTFAGSGSSGFQDGNLSNASFNFPSKMAFDTIASILYISDVGNHAIRKIDLSKYVGIQEQGVLKSVKIYPNPARDHIEIDLSQIVNTQGLYEVSITIHNKLGETVLIQRGISSDVTYIMNIGHLTSGIYTLSLEQKGVVLQTTKFIKE